MRRAWICLALILLSAPGFAQTVEPPSAEDLSIQAFLQAVEGSVQAMDRQRNTLTQTRRLLSCHAAPPLTT